MPLLSHALLETWKRRRGHTLTLAGYQAVGGVHGALAQTAENLYRSFSAEQQAIARRIFLRLTELGEGTQDTRRRAALSELAGGAADERQARAVLQGLAGARLVTTQQDCAEVAHEALIREWPTLRGWLDEDRDGLRVQRHLTQAAGEWERRGRDPGDLYRGARLARAQEWAGEHAASLSAAETEFLRASRVALRGERRAARLRWAGIAALGLLAALVAALGITGQFNRLIYSPALRPPVLEEHWATIPAGEFWMGSTVEQLAKLKELYPDNDFWVEQPRHQVFLDAFQIMAFEATNAQYLQCVRARVCSPPANTRYDDAGLARRPVTDVNWEMAQEFCQWIGARLPSEAEWEKAARGGLEDGLYPWGDEEPDCGRANSGGCEGDTSPVGSYPANGYGLYDMAGNVWEWTADWFGEYPAGPQANPAGPETGDSRVVRGGGWRFGRAVLHAALRMRDAPSSTDDNLGLRCSRSLPPSSRPESGAFTDAPGAPGKRAPAPPAWQPPGKYGIAPPVQPASKPGVRVGRFCGRR